ncbi:MAG TPA: glycosyltransferase family 39 protein [Solirubrobacteraceae bacterium]|nr:glycosyltransferase family 39 protein [Solirubrobacteraceae bacterium]
MSRVARETKVRGPIRHARALGAAPWAVVGTATVAAAVLRFVRIGHQGFWFDEANTALLVHFSPGQMLGVLPKTESTPPLYYCVAWVWARVFGFRETGLRSLSAVAGVLTVPVAYAAGAKLISRRAGLIVAALVATSPLLIWYSQEARSYALVVLLTAGTLLTFAYALSDPTGRSLVAWAMACALALATHYFAVLAVAPEAAWLLVVHRRRRPVQAAVGVIALAGLALVPLAVSQQGTGNSNWIAHIPLPLRLGQVTPQFLLGFGAPAGRWLRGLDAVVVIAAAALVGWRGDRAERHGARLAAGIAVAGAVVMLVILAAGDDELITRNIIVLWLPLALVVAAGLSVPRARRLGMAGVAVLCLTGVAAAVGVAVDRNLERPDWRLVARALGPAPANAGRAILIQHYRTLLPLSLDQPRLRFMPRVGAVVDELDVIAIHSPQENACWWGAACNLIPSRLQPSYPVRGFSIAGERHIAQFTLLRLRSAAPVRLTGPMVSRALTGTELRHDGLILQSASSPPRDAGH